MTARGLRVDREVQRAGAVGEVEWLEDPVGVHHVAAVVVDRLHPVVALAELLSADERVLVGLPLLTARTELRIGRDELVDRSLRGVVLLAETGERPAALVEVARPAARVLGLERVAE